MTGILAAVWFAITVPADVSPEIRQLHRDQEKAVEVVERLGGRVFYEYQGGSEPNSFNPDARPPDPDKLYWVVFIDLKETRIKDDDLKILRKFPHLVNLDLEKTNITGTGLEYLSDLQDLACLNLAGTNVDDAALKHLNKHKKLWMLLLDQTKITDDGLKHLSQLTNLEEWLGLTGTEITDDGLKHLHKLTKLRHLNLRLTAVTDKAAKELKKKLTKADISQGP